MIDFNLLYFFFIFFAKFLKKRSLLINLNNIYLIISVFYIFFEIYRCNPKKKDHFLLMILFIINLLDFIDFWKSLDMHPYLTLSSLIQLFHPLRLL